MPVWKSRRWTKLHRHKRLRGQAQSANEIHLYASAKPSRRRCYLQRGPLFESLTHIGNDASGYVTVSLTLCTCLRCAALRSLAPPVSLDFPPAYSILLECALVRKNVRARAVLSLPSSILTAPATTHPHHHPLHLAATYSQLSSTLHLHIVTPSFFHSSTIRRRLRHLVSPLTTPSIL